MGWLSMRDLGGHPTPRAYLDDQFSYSSDDHKLTVLASSMVGSTYYAACRRTEASGDTSVFALVCLTKLNAAARDGFFFGYKDMTEHMGPSESRCPASILDLLSESESDCALAWRARCRAALARRRMERAKPDPRPGQTILFDEPLRFDDGADRYRFVVTPNPKGGRPLLRDPETGAVCRIPGLKSRGYRLIDPAIRWKVSGND